MADFEYPDSSKHFTNWAEGSVEHRALNFEFGLTVKEHLIESLKLVTDLLFVIESIYYETASMLWSIIMSWWIVFVQSSRCRMPNSVLVTACSAVDPSHMVSAGPCQMKKILMLLNMFVFVVNVDWFVSCLSPPGMPAAYDLSTVIGSGPSVSHNNLIPLGTIHSSRWLLNISWSLLQWGTNRRATERLHAWI